MEALVFVIVVLGIIGLIIENLEQVIGFVIIAFGLLVFCAVTKWSWGVLFG